MSHILPYEKWLLLNEEDLVCSASESGADREPGFDSDAWAEKKYQEYVERKFKI